MAIQHFYIYGKAGDIIYAMPAIRAHSGGGVIINGLPIAQHELLKSIVDYQDGFTLEHESYYGVPTGTINLEICRYQPIPKQHLCLSFAKVLNVQVDIKQSWLKAPALHPVFKMAHRDFVVVNITQNYRDKLFDWKKVLSLTPRYKSFFLGLRTESHPYTLYTKYYPLNGDGLQGAALIDSCSMFLGTQSLWLAVAEGLGANYGFERSPFYDNTITGRTNEKILNSNFTRKLHYTLSSMQSIARKIRYAVLLVVILSSCTQKKVQQTFKIDSTIQFHDEDPYWHYDTTVIITP